MLHLIIYNEGRQETLCFENRILLSDALHLNHIPLDMPCAGKGRCKQCRIKVQGKVSPLSKIEEESLTAEELNQGVRLACLTYLEGDASVWLFTRSEMENIVVNGTLPAFDRNPMSHNYGVSVDIGTTTVTTQFYRLSDCTAVGARCMKNPQSEFGADVISRIEGALAGKGEQLFRAIAGGIDSMVQEMANEARIALSQVDSMVITGNTTMLYFLTKQDVDCLSHAPFEADTLFGEYRKASQLGILSVPSANVYLPRCISSFVGADITMAILASNIYEEGKTSLLIDIGTNGEIALCKKGKIYCCSTAAGPAFEGAGIQMGTNSVRGAIHSVRLKEGKIICTTIANAPASGICGSGVIDAVAVLCESNVLDETGLLQEKGHSFETFVVEYNGQRAFRINGDNIVITQKDIRMVQLAKSAICAGMLTLIAHVGLSFDEIDTLYIAGGFGSYINLENAARIGLIPPELTGKAVVIGNAAASGAAMLLQNLDFVQKSSTLAENAATVDLTGDPDFSENYIECMMF